MKTSTRTENNLWTRFTRHIQLFGTTKERDYVVDNISMLVASGMGISQALSAVAAEIRSRTLKKVIQQIQEDIESGFPLWRALDASHMFAPHTISLIRIGEESGKLAENLRVVSLQQEKERAFRSKIRSAMMYPLFVLSLTVVIGIGIAWFILPKLANVFSQLKINLPTVTKVLINTGSFLGEHGSIVVPSAVVALGIIIFFLFFFGRTKFIGQSMMFLFPGIKGLIQEVEITRFGYLLGTLLQAGLPITQALQSLSQATFFPHYKKLYEFLTEHVGEGDSFARCFTLYSKSNRLIPTPIQQLIVVGEQSGNLPETLTHISQNYEAKSDNTTKNIAVILEPILLVIVWLGVVAVALAVILPIYSLIGGLKT